ncbi:hypothetical protein AB3N02_31340 [Priestia aryabhattai]
MYEHDFVFKTMYDLNSKEIQRKLNMINEFLEKERKILVNVQNNKV